MIAEGSFETSTSNAPPYDVVDGVAFHRSKWERRFRGELDATSQMEMLGARTETPGCAGYVALERVSGSLHGRRGSFALLHMAVMSDAGRSLVMRIVPRSGTGELRHIAGSMEIRVEAGERFYRLDYVLDPNA